MRKKILYVASLPHSGSTLLNLLLGQHPAMVGLGGIDSAVQWIVRKPDEAAAETCSCGEKVGACPFWGKVLAAVKDKLPMTCAERYEVALHHFVELFGEDVWPVDSGQIRETVDALAGLTNLDLRALFLARDVRSAIVSIVDLKLRRKAMRRPRLFLALEAALRWKRENGRIIGALQRSGVPRLDLGYEELCLRLDGTYARVCDFLGIASYQPTREVHAGKNHSFVGNDMRKQSTKVNVVYDYRWMTRSDWWVPGLLIPGLMRANREWVYSAGEDAIFRR